MDQAERTIDLVEIIKVALIVAIPTALLLMVVSFFLKGRNRDIKESDPVEMAIMKESMMAIAKEKISQREKEPDTDNPQKLETEEVRKKIEEERDEYDEFELIEPIEELDNIDPEDKSNA